MQDMQFYDKFVDRFQDISKVKSPAVSKAKVWQLLRAFKIKYFWGIWCCHIDHALLKGSFDMVSQSSETNFSDAAIIS